MKRILTAALVAAAVAGCTDAQGGGPVAASAALQQSARVDLRAARASLIAADEAHAAAAASRGFVDGFTAYLADDVRFLAPNEGVIQGRAAVRAWFAGNAYNGGSLSWAPIRGDVSADGQSGYTFGSGEGRLGTGTFIRRRYISYWKRQPDGGWKVAAHVPMPVRAAAAPAPEWFNLFRDNGLRGQPAWGTESALEQVMQADRDFAALGLTDPQAAFVRFAARDGVLADGPLYGREQIGAAFANATGLRMEWGPAMGELAASGDLAYTIGFNTSTFPNGAQQRTKYLSIWERQPNGEWRYAVDGGNVVLN